MATSKVRRDRDNGDDVQDMGVRRMQKQSRGSIPSEGGDRRVSLGAMRLHKRHIQSRREGGPKCNCGSEGLAGLYTQIREVGPDPSSLDESDGTDEEGSAPPPPDSRAGDGEDPLLWQ